MRAPEIRSVNVASKAKASSSIAADPGMSPEGVGADNADTNKSRLDNSRSLGVLRLSALLFFGVSGGPLGTEGLVKSAGPLYSLVGLCILPIVWCFPVGLMTAELATAFPKDGGYVWWVDAAFGSFWGFMMGWISWAGGVVDNAIYPGMFLSFMTKSFDLKLSAFAQQAVLVAFNVVLAATNLVGIGVAGSASVVFCGVVLMPVAILVLVALPSMSPTAWLAVTPEVNWVDWVNIAVWNSNRWESCSTFATQVANPIKTFPAAILLAGFAVIVPYILCIMAATGVDQDYDSYENGTYNVIALKEGGWFLGALFTVGTSAAAAGMYVSDMTTYSYQLSGMAEEGMVPRIFAAKLPRLGTPFVAIGLQFVVVMLLSHMDFHDILVCDNVLYCGALLMELCAMVKLRISQPNLPRPFKIPTGTLGVFVMMCGPAAFCWFVLLSSSVKVLALSSLIVGVGVGIWFFTAHLRDGNGKLILPFLDGSVQSYSAL